MKCHQNRYQVSRAVLTSGELFGPENVRPGNNPIHTLKRDRGSITSRLTYQELISNNFRSKGQVRKKIKVNESKMKHKPPIVPWEKVRLKTPRGRLHWGQPCKSRCRSRHRREQVSFDSMPMRTRR